MPSRTSKTTVTFAKPFILDGYGEELPAGAYAVETDEEMLQGLSFPAFRRRSVRIHLHPTPDHPGRRETLVIDPEVLDAALARDRAAGQEAGDADGQAADRADDEGMLTQDR